MLHTLSRSFAAVHRRALTQVTRQPKLSSSVVALPDARDRAFRARLLGVSTVWQRSAIQPSDSRIHEKPPVIGLADYEGAGFAVYSKVRGENDDEIKDKAEVDWCRDQEFDELAKELVELYGELHDCIRKLDKEGRIAGQEAGRVKHLGHQVYVQNNLYPLDRDANEVSSPVTVTRRESRSVVEHALSVLKSRGRVCVTGQPGIGKTRGSMMYALQTLLSRKAAVIYVGYKDERMVLFLPDEKGNYRTWTSEADDFRKTRMKRDERVVVVIDPREKGAYMDEGGCRILKFVSNNSKKHYHNWEKDGVLLVTSMPSKEEVLAMTEVLWSDNRTPLAGTEFEDKHHLVEHRMRFVGPVPRLVFDGDRYFQALEKGLSGAHEVAKEMTEGQLYSALIGTYSPHSEKHPTAAASGVLFLNPYRAPWDTAEERKPRYLRQQLTPVARWSLRQKLDNAFKKFRPHDFEDYAFHRMCVELGCRLETDSESWNAAVEKIKALSESDDVLFRPKVSNFPLVDFARSNKHWYNAKSADLPMVSLGGAFNFLKKMGLVKPRGDDDVPGWIATEEGKRFRRRLTLVTKTDADPIIKPDKDWKKHGNAKEQEELFGRLVEVDTKIIYKEDMFDSKQMEDVKQELVDLGIDTRIA